MEKVRVVMLRSGLSVDHPDYVAALAEVEEWEARQAAFERKLAFAGYDSKATDRAVAAEAERDRLRERLSYLATEWDCSCETPGTDYDCPSCTARAALGEQT